MKTAAAAWQLFSATIRMISHSYEHRYGRSKNALMFYFQQLKFQPYVICFPGKDGLECL